MSLVGAPHCPPPSSETDLPQVMPSKVMCRCINGRSSLQDDDTEIKMTRASGKSRPSSRSATSFCTVLFLRDLLCTSYPSSTISSLLLSDSSELQAALKPPNPEANGFCGPRGSSSFAT
uniref:(northern house mosquito) hypothetical protein n=1 Tax=Culex pipiens TaxID=7175 RepID=A0A8D8IC08_CULPI